jgi:hypothetical protein
MATRTPAQIEAILRLLIQGLGHADISARLGMDAKSRPSMGTWYYFKSKYLLNEKYADVEAMQRQLAADGFTLTVVELNQLLALHQTPSKYGPKTRNVAHNSTALKANEAVLTQSIKSEWLLREGIPYAEADEKACTTPMVKVRGNVCGVQIEQSRRFKGKTTCQTCDDVSRQAPSERRPAASAQRRQTFKPYNYSSR